MTKKDILALGRLATASMPTGSERQPWFPNPGTGLHCAVPNLVKTWRESIVQTVSEETPLHVAKTVPKHPKPCCNDPMNGCLWCGSRV